MPAEQQQSDGPGHQAQDWGTSVVLCPHIPTPSWVAEACICAGTHGCGGRLRNLRFFSRGVKTLPKETVSNTEWS